MLLLYLQNTYQGVWGPGGEVLHISELGISGGQVHSVMILCE